MKNWNAAEIVELNINETAHNFFGNEYDNGYVGDGHVGILQWGNEGGNKGDDEEEKLS